VDCYTASTKVVDPHDTADDVSTYIVKDQDFPYRFSVRVDNGSGFRKEAVGMIIMFVAMMNGSFVQVQYLLNGSLMSLMTVYKKTLLKHTNLSVPQGLLLRA
jgi:hypothetical protein